MTYNPTEYTEGIAPKPGDRIDGTITDIETGNLGTFIAPEVAAKWKSFNAQARAIKVTMTNAENRQFQKVITLPADPKNVPARSRFGKWKKYYGAWPTIGQKVWVLANADGYFDFQA
jgi:hypothetical protein